MALSMKTLRGCEVYQSLNKVIHWIASADVALLFHSLSHLLDMEIAFLSGRANSRETKNKARSRFSSLVERKRKSGTIVVEYF